MSVEMRVALLERQNVMKMTSRPRPEPGPGEVLVRVHRVGVCGSDVHYYTHGRIGTFVVEKPIVLGHEMAGVIEGVGAGVPGDRIGERVAVEPGVPDRTCEWCRAGRYNLCPNVVFMATPPYDGALADYIVTRLRFRVQAAGERHARRRRAHGAALGRRFTRSIVAA